MRNSGNTFLEELLVKGETPTRSAIQNSNKIKNEENYLLSTRVKLWKAVLSEITLLVELQNCLDFFNCFCWVSWVYTVSRDTHIILFISITGEIPAS